MSYRALLLTIPALCAVAHATVPPQSLLDQTLYQLPQGRAAQCRAGFERAIEVVGKVDGGAHKYILMRLRFYVNFLPGG